MSKTFSLGEAHTLLPLLESLMVRAQRSALRGAELELEMEQLNQRIFLAGGMRVDVAVAARRRAERDKAAQEAQDTIAEIEEIGAAVHDLPQGMLDLPMQVDGSVVMLCWKVGEAAVEHWHAAGEPVEERKPLDGRFGRGDRDRLN
jgi:hypothetical protein